MAEEGKRDGGGDQDTPHAHYYVFTAHKVSSPFIGPQFTWNQKWLL